MPSESTHARGILAAVVKTAMVFVLVLSVAGTAAGQIIYNSIPSPLPGNVVSEGPEAYAFRELGDGLIFAGTQRNLVSIKVIMSDWACTNGAWFNPAGTPNPCVTSPAGATFKQPITINIYKVNAGPSAGPLLFTKTVTFDIPYRPSSDGVHCAPNGNNHDGKQWYNPVDNTCYHGLAFPITFDFTGDGVVLPNQAIVTLSFNTTSAGPSPIGPAPACFGKPHGCPYDSLNISTDGSPSIGSDLDPNGIWFNYINSANSCNAGTPTGVLLDDTPCFPGAHPEMLVNTTPLDTFQIGYAANLQAGDSYIDLTSAGALSGDDSTQICANIYVLAADQQLIACCSCPLTPNHLTGVSVRNDLANNLLTPGGLPPAVTIAVTASVNSPCDAAQAVNYAPGLRAWGTTLHAKPGGGYVNTETKFLIVPPSTSELAKLTSFCGFIQSNGSGHGICDSCTPPAGGGGGGKPQ